jgi:hypothetical protein
MRNLVRKPALAWTALALCLGGGRAALAESNRNLETRLETNLPLIEQIAPSDGAVLVGGQTAELRWSELAAFAQLEEIEEWEAFLSVDGGKSYPFRITPHLDHDVRALRWQVPPVATPDARLLFRFGNERKEEVGFRPPVRFKIAVEASSPPPITLAEASSSRGEAALSGQPGVLSWVAGSRRGTGLRQVEARCPIELHPTPGLAAGFAFEPVPFAPDERRIEVRADLGASSSLSPQTAKASFQRGTESPAPPISPLLQTQRQNE